MVILDLWQLFTLIFKLGFQPPQNGETRPRIIVEFPEFPEPIQKPLQKLLTSQSASQRISDYAIPAPGDHPVMPVKLQIGTCSYASSEPTGTWYVFIFRWCSDLIYSDTTDFLCVSQNDRPSFYIWEKKGKTNIILSRMLLHILLNKQVMMSRYP